jgi:hypothetical protein
MDNLPSNTILSQIDFSKNYSFEMQNKIQSMHWHSFQVTILVHITFRVDPTNGQGNDDKKIIKGTHFYVSNHKEHDTLFAQYCLFQCIGTVYHHGESNQHITVCGVMVVLLKVVEQCILLQDI